MQYHPWDHRTEKEQGETRNPNKVWSLIKGNITRKG